MFLSACSEDPSTGDTTNETAEEIRQQIVMQTGIDLIPLDFLGWDLQLPDITGQVVVMNFWASWCFACLDSFPVMLDIASRYPSSEVRFISVNLDDYENEDAYISAMDFLASSNADIENYHIQQELTDIYQFFGLENIPTIIVYSRAGDEQARLGNQAELLEPILVGAIEQALARPLEQ